MRPINSIGRRSQPQNAARLNHSNPITRGLISVVHARNLWRTNPTFGMTPGGLALAPQASGFGVLYTSDDKSVTEPVAPSTIFSYEYHKTNPDYNSGAVYYHDNSSDWPNDLGLVLISPSTYGYAQVEARATDGWRYQAKKKVIAANSLTTPCFLKRTSTLDANFLMTAYGGASTEESSCSAKNWGTDTTMQGHSYNPSTKTYAAPKAGIINALDANSYLILMLRWNRVLSEAEIRSIHENPWQVFTNIQPVRFLNSIAVANKFRRSLSLGTGTGKRQIIGV